MAPPMVDQPYGPPPNQLMSDAEYGALERQRADVLAKDGAAALIDASGALVHVPLEKAGAAIRGGFRPATEQDIQKLAIQKSAGEHPWSALLSSVSGSATLGASEYARRKEQEDAYRGLGLDPSLAGFSQQQEVAQNPWASGIGNVAGALVPIGGPARLIKGFGSLMKGAGEGATGLLARGALGAARLGGEGVILGGGSVLEHMGRGQDTTGEDAAMALLEGAGLNLGIGALGKLGAWGLGKVRGSIAKGAAGRIEAAEGAQWEAADKAVGPHLDRLAKIQKDAKDFLTPEVESQIDRSRALLARADEMEQKIIGRADILNAKVRAEQELTTLRGNVSASLRKQGTEHLSPAALQRLEQAGLLEKQAADRGDTYWELMAKADGVENTAAEQALKVRGRARKDILALARDEAKDLRRQAEVERRTFAKGLNVQAQELRASVKEGIGALDRTMLSDDIVAQLERADALQGQLGDLAQMGARRAAVADLRKQAAGELAGLDRQYKTTSGVPVSRLLEEKALVEQELAGARQKAGLNIIKDEAGAIADHAKSHRQAIAGNYARAAVVGGAAAVISPKLVALAAVFGMGPGGLRAKLASAVKGAPVAAKDAGPGWQKVAAGAGRAADVVGAAYNATRLVPAVMLTQKSYDSVAERLGAMDEQDFGNHLQEQAQTMQQALGVDPQVTQDAAARQLRQLIYLQMVKPKAPKPASEVQELSHKEKWEPSSRERLDFSLRYKAAMQPSVVLDELQKGPPSRQTMETLAMVYPQELLELQEQVRNVLRETINTGKTISISRQRALDVLLGHPSVDREYGQMLAQVYADAQAAAQNQNPAPRPMGGSMGQNYATGVESTLRRIG